MNTMGAFHPQFGREEADSTVRRAVRRYIRRRRAMVPKFIERNFGLRGALKLHRYAVGWDLLRAPANLALAGPNLLFQVLESVAERGGRKETAAWLRRQQRIFVTEISREIEWRLFAELLELPYAPPGRPAAGKDALAEEIVRDPVVERTLAALASVAGTPRFRAWAKETAGRYGHARLAVADLATSLATAGVGAAAFKQWTPGALSLGPVVAQVLAQQAAVASFPLGAWAGGLWYGLFPAAVPAAVTGLSVVERAFRSLKTVDLKVRPIYHYAGARVRAHVFLCMLAYYVEWHMRQRLKPLLFDDEESQMAEAARPSVVAPAEISPSAQDKARRIRTASGESVHSFRTLLDDLATIAKNRVVTPLTDAEPFDLITRPSALQRKAFTLLGVRLERTQ